MIAVGAFLGSALSQRWQATEAEAGGALPVPAPAERVRVEVLNGGGREGMARAATDVLRDGGFDVVFFGNAPSFGQDSSVVLDRVGRLDMARSVADALGIRQVRSQPDTNLYLDVTVVLGEEWSRAPAASSEAGSPPAWWSPRRWRGPEEREPPGIVADPPPG